MGAGRMATGRRLNPMSTYRIYACDSEDRARRVYMYTVTGAVEWLEVKAALGLRSLDSDNDYEYYIDKWNAMWWVKLYLE